ncbi:MAG: response regulator [Terriglobales bacterium]|jgi:CheY-like chemotaxis protein
MPSLVQNAVNNAVVLCIDDDPAILECEKRFLETFGYKVLTAASGSKGLELASIHPVDVVIVDYCMPGMNGPEVAIEIKRLRPQAPIIMLSGAVDIPKKALKTIDAFVAKDRLGSQLLPVIAELHKGGGSVSARTRISS